MAIYTIDVDANLDTRLKEFQKQLKEGEEIIQTTSAGNKLIVTTRESKKKNSKLLLESVS